MKHSEVDLELEKLTGVVYIIFRDSRKNKRKLKNGDTRIVVLNNARFCFSL